jgi:hypothetical protein
LALRKDTWPDGYIAIGPLEQIGGPGRRTVRRLELRRPSGDLAVLAQFRDLEALTIQDAAAPLDLAPLADLAGLEDLTIVNVAAVAVPHVLPLPGSLRLLAIINDARGLDGAPVAQLIEAIDWSRLQRLTSLVLRVGGLYDLAPVTADLSFLRGLDLEQLSLTGVDGA